MVYCQYNTSQPLRCRRQIKFNQNKLQRFKKYLFENFFSFIWLRTLSGGKTWLIQWKTHQVIASMLGVICSKFRNAMIGTLLVIYSACLKRVNNSDSDSEHYNMYSNQYWYRILKISAHQDENQPGFMK